MKPVDYLVLDANVWLDFYLGNRPGHDTARSLIQAAQERGLNLLVPITVLDTFVYLMRIELKALEQAERGEVSERAGAAIRETAWAALDNLLEIATPLGAGVAEARIAYKYRRLHNDFEDNLIVAAVQKLDGAYLVSNDRSLLQHAPVAALDSHDALALVEANDERLP